MERLQTIEKPLFELGLKAYLYGGRAVELAVAQEQIGLRYAVTTILTPQVVDIPAISRATRDLLVFAPHLDPVGVGAGSGSILAEALKEAGAAGVLLNHAEKQLTLSHIARAIERAGEAGLLSMVCADSAEQAAAIARLGPDMIMAEPPSLIGGSKPVATAQRDFILSTLEMVRAIDPEIIIFNSAGIRTGEDAAAVIRAGADGTGSTSGVLNAPDPVAKLEEMIRAVHEAWIQSRG